MEKFTYQQIWDHQVTITYIANYRFGILNYLKNQYDKDNLAASNRFITESMYAFRETVVIDLCKLFIKPNENGVKIEQKFKSNNQLNFYYNLYKYRDEIDGEIFDKSIQLLQSIQEDVNQLLIVRDKEIGHKDLNHSSIHSFHTKDIPQLGHLVEKAKEIITIYQYNFDFDPMYSDDYSNPEYVKDVLDAINEQRNTKYDLLNSGTTQLIK